MLIVIIMKKDRYLSTCLVPFVFPLLQVERESTLYIAKMPGFFNITKFNCRGENRISSSSNTIMVVNVGKRLPRARVEPTGEPLPYTVAIHLVAAAPAWYQLGPYHRGAVPSCKHQFCAVHE